MNTIAVFAVVVVMVTANPMADLQRTLNAKEGQFVLTKDYSLEDGHQYEVKFVKSYSPGKPLPLFPYNMDSSEEVHYYLASEQGQKRQSWSERVKKLRHVLTTGLDVSDEAFHTMYSTGILNLPADRQYFVDSSGEIYYDAARNQL